MLEVLIAGCDLSVELMEVSEMWVGYWHWAKVLGELVRLQGDDILGCLRWRGGVGWEQAKVVGLGSYQQGI